MSSWPCRPCEKIVQRRGCEIREAGGTFVSRFDFPFDFFFDLLAFQKWIVCFPCICQFSSFLALIDFQFHTVVVINNHLKFVETCFVVQHMVLENVPCALEKNEYSAAVGCNALDMFVRFIYSVV